MEAILLQNEITTRKNSRTRALLLSEQHEFDNVGNLAQEFQNLQSSLRALQEHLRNLVANETVTTNSIHDNNAASTKFGEVTVSAIDNADDVTVEWLLRLCETVASDLEPIQLARAVVDVSTLNDDTQQQTALFDIFGASDEVIHVLIEITSKLAIIRQKIPMQDLERHFATAVSTTQRRTYESIPDGSQLIDIEEERRQLLLQEAMDTAQIAAIAQAQVDAITGTTSNGSTTTTSSTTTHTILRTSDIQAMKLAEKAKKRAAQALQRAIDAGVILNDSDLLAVDARQQMGEGGLVNRTNDEIWALQQSLLPEGTREYYDHRGLPKDAIREKIGDMERVIVPATKHDEAMLPKRLMIVDIMDTQLASAFEGTTSLNHMQSATFNVAFHSRDNMMVCAPVSFKSFRQTRF
jgi:hypothetical protein